ncbi:MAG: hypothetical protein D6785_08650 [Planctomycetota bacterium]|nr:MAG: hypothetical protein D6785_08650 [Planctomycetota bacterium]
MKILGICLSTLFFLFLGFYWANLEKVKAGTLRLIGYYGPGNGLYPLSGSSYGKLRKINMAGGRALSLKCSIQASPSFVKAKYLEILSRLSGLKEMDPLLRKETAKLPLRSKNGVFEVEDTQYAMLGTYTKSGSFLGVLIFKGSLNSTTYTLFRSLSPLQEENPKPPFLLNLPFSRLEFSMEDPFSREKIYFYHASYSPKNFKKHLIKMMLREGWKRKHSGVYPSSLSFFKENQSCTLFLTPLKKGYYISAVIQPKSKVK